MNDQPEHVTKVLDNLIAALRKLSTADPKLVEGLRTLKENGQLADKTKVVEVLA
jgi:hypothetical protein